MKTAAQVFSFLLLSIVALGSQFALADAKVMNPGEAYGQLIFISTADVTTETPKYKALSPLSIPVFEELPLDLSVVAGAVTLKQQTLLSHVQLKSRARKTPNLDISDLQGGMKNPLLSKFKDGEWVHMLLGADGKILIELSTEAAANTFYARKKSDPIQLKADLSVNKIFASEELHSSDFVSVGSKTANYGELMRAVNTASRTVVRPGFGIPFYYYQEFIETNPKVKASIDSVLRDPLMAKVAKVSYREAKLKALQALMTSDEAVVNDKLVDELLSRFDQLRDSKGLPRKMKLRSATNSEDLPNFNGAGLYDSFAYKPTKDGVEKTQEKKRKAIKETLRSVWASVWNLRAFDERAYFQIPHADVKMGIQVNLAFDSELADGVVVTKNAAHDPALTGPGVYIEVQRGSEYSVTNPVPGIKPQKVLVLIDAQQPLEQASYDIHVLQNSNVGDDNKTILSQDNPIPVLSNDEIKDLAYQVMKAQAHFKPILGANKADFALDLEFKIDTEDTAVRQIYLKQARPYLE